jgi:hypothetical protein
METLRRLLLVVALAVGLFACGGGSDPSPVPPSTTSLPVASALQIQPVAQQTMVWCWAASAQMVFQYYGLPNLNPGGNYQCGIVAAYFGQFFPACLANCLACVHGIPSMDQEQLLLNGYGQLANQVGVFSRVLTSTLLFSALTMDQLATEIAAGRPVLAGISPSGVSYPDFSQHAVVIVGYDTSGVPRLIVNDPFPYQAAGQPDPYLFFGGVQLKPGQYSIPYTSFVHSLQWGNTLYGIR